MRWKTILPTAYVGLHFRICQSKNEWKHWVKSQTSCRLTALLVRMRGSLTNEQRVGSGRCVVLDGGRGRMKAGGNQSITDSGRVLLSSLLLCLSLTMQ